MDRAGLFHRLRAALRSCQLYPREGRARAEAIAGLHAALEGLLADRAAVRLAFLEDGVWIHGEPVPGGGKDDSLGPSIFGCGIREIHFLAGVERVELERFLEPLGRALLGSLNPLDEDLSLLLWEAELPHICYLLFEEPAEEPEVAPAAETSEGAYALEEYLDPDQDAGEGDVATALRPLGAAARGGVRGDSMAASGRGRAAGDPGEASARGDGRVLEVRPPPDRAPPQRVLSRDLRRAGRPLSGLP